MQRSELDLCWGHATWHAGQPRPGLRIASVDLGHCMTRVNPLHAMVLSLSACMKDVCACVHCVHPVTPCQSMSTSTPCPQSCLAIAESVGGSQASGNYWVGAGAGATRVYCDMLKRTVVGNGATTANSGHYPSVCLTVCVPARVPACVCACLTGCLPVYRSGWLVVWLSTPL